ncbi:MAG: DUF1573 domain-containing protein [Bacteroidota bacterium]|nr:DUF1573 domain-containing protein [Bacteroidota bacterium]
MKNISFFSFVLVGLLSWFLVGNKNMTVAEGEKAVVTWSKVTHDFGKIPQGTPVTAEFSFKNTGKIPMVLTNVQASCGCTVPTWPKEPIQPGQSSKISATYNAAGIGSFNKVVTVYSNTESGTLLLTLKGEVIPKQ